MTTNAPNKYQPLKMPKNASPAPPLPKYPISFHPPMKEVPLAEFLDLHAELKKLRDENKELKKMLPTWRVASSQNNVGDNTWCILYSSLYGVGTGYWSPCYGWMFCKDGHLTQTDSITHWMPLPEAPTPVEP